MGKAFSVLVVGVLLLAALLVAINVSAEGTETGSFPTRTFSVTRSPPGGPKSDTYRANATPSESGQWSVVLDSIAGSAVIVQVYKVDGGVPVLEASSRLRMVGDESTPVTLQINTKYEFAFTPYGKAGTSILSERFVVNEPPTACFSYSPATPTTLDTITFDGRCSTDSDGTIAAYDWDFTSDGTIDASGAVVSHRYDVAGTHRATLRVTDNLGAWSETFQDITVEVPANRPPTASFTYSPAAPKVLDPITFDGSSSSDVDGFVVMWEWDFTNDGIIDATGVSATTSYDLAGPYVVRLRVWDDRAAFGETTRSVVVSPNDSPIASFAWSPTTPKAVHDTVEFDGRASYDPDGSIVLYEWDFTSDGIVDASGPTASTIYGAAGSYFVTLKVTDNKGASGSRTEQITVVENLPPVAAFTWSPLSPKQGELVAFDGRGSSDPDGMVVLYEWDFASDGIVDATGPTATHAYAFAGPYDVTLHVTDDNGAMGMLTQSITVRALVPPIACFSYLPAGIKVGTVVSFDAGCSTDDGSIVLYEWDFGDGFSGSGVTATHAYSDAGSYVVTLKVTDDDGLSDTEQATLDVTPNTRPVAVFTYAPASPLSLEPVDFDGRASYDPDAAFGDSIVSYAWTFGDGGSASGPTATHTYTAPGRYVATLTVTDSYGAQGSASADVVVGNRGPVAVLRLSATDVLTLVEVEADASGSYDPDGTTLAYLIDWGDGATATTAIARHAYERAGSYVVALTVTDVSGAFATATASVNVGNRAPTAAFTFSPAAPGYGDPIHFDASSSSDMDGVIATYAWIWGDDTTGAGAHIFDKAYAAPGSYVVRLTVTDDGGASDFTEKTVVVVNDRPVARLSLSATDVLTLVEIEADGSASSDPEGELTSYRIAWGDGTPDATTAIATHAYADDGTYDVTLTVTDRFGSSDVATASVLVRNRAPTASLSLSAASVLTGEPVEATGTASDEDGTIASASIDWGEGPTTPGLTGTHVYADDGIYTVRLTVTDDDGATASATADVEVRNRPPMASFVFSPASPHVGRAIHFDASGSSDPDGTITSYAWIWGDDTTGAGAHIFDKVYTREGSFVVRLTVTDNDGATAFTEKTVVVVNDPPVAVLQLSATSVLTLADVEADASMSYDPDGSSLTYRIAWGDGTPDAMTAVARHAYADDGLYTVTLTVTDAYGKPTSTSADVTVANRPPTATLTVDPTSARGGILITATGTASDADGTIASASIDWGDGATTEGLTGTHAYGPVMIDTLYTVRLSVTDNDAAPATAEASVLILAEPEPPKPPTAAFTYSPAAPRVDDVVSFDASGSTDPDGTIVSYDWNFGDSSSGTGAMPTHAYTAAGDYTVVLTVTDDDGLSDTESAVVTVLPKEPTGPGIDYRYYDFFAVPFGEWWDIRTFWWYDRPIGSECFSADGIATGWCFPFDPGLPDVAQFPYTNWMPSPYSPGSEAFIFAPYRFSANIRDNAAYTIAKPVILPTCDALRTLGLPVTCPTSPSGGSVDVDLYLQYTSSARAEELAARGCPAFAGSNDGFISELRLTLTMDTTASSRLFGVTDGALWANGTADTALIKQGCGPGAITDVRSGKLEQALVTWYEDQGNGPYDIFNAFRATMDVVAVEAWGSYDAGTGKHSLFVTLIGWGNEALLARWFYWGATTYQNGVLNSVAPTGWWGMEHPWFEDLRLRGTIGETSFSALVTGVMQNHFQHLAEAGDDATWYTSDDVAKWVWMPVLADRIYGVPGHTTTELKPYTGLTYVHSTPSTRRYGTSYFYDYVPAVWALKTGEKQVFEFPRATVVLYDPLSPKLFDPTADPLTLIPIATAIVFHDSVPATGVGTYDVATWTLTVIGPSTPGTPPSVGGKPLESRPIYNLRAPA